jgi:acyl-homoserine lactone acylase PvdQ
MSSTLLTVETLVLATLLPACAAVRRDVRGFVDPGWRAAQQVVIHRDAWGVPHIEGPTDASVVFGLAYAQAEDNFWQLEEDFIHALGWAARLYGEQAVANDLVRLAFEVERLSREEYAREPGERRALWDAYAAGLNYFLRTRPDVEPRLIRRFEPWFVFARFRPASAATVVDGVALANVVAVPVGQPEIVERARGTSTAIRLGAAGAQGRTASNECVVLLGPACAAGLLDAGPGPAAESNAWAVAPSRTRDGHALLFQNPHVGFFGAGQRWEVHLRSDAGWHVSGFAILGTPIPRAGHNEHLGWTHTNTAADVEDAYVVRFDHPTNPLAYRYAEGWRDAIEREATLLVRTPGGLERRRYRFLRTHHGPVVSAPDGRRIAIRVARFEDGGSLQQWYEMGRARSLSEFRAALGRTALSISNTMYADQAGNIMYVHGNAVPRREPRFDWTRPVDGSDPTTEWRGYHALDELPQLVNPSSGWIQNTNSTPFLATGEGSNLRREDYPSYMAREADNARAQISRRILAADSAWTASTWAAAAFDTQVLTADAQIPYIIDEWERAGAGQPDRAARLDEAIELLRDWDRVSTIESAAMTLYVYWSEAMLARRAAEPDSADDSARDWPRVRALEQAVARLVADWGRARVAWGEVNRLQRVHTSGDEPFDDAKPSLPVAGGPGGVGMVFNIGTRPGPDGRRRYGVRGHTWVGVVEFGASIVARSIVTFGQSADPASPHWFDQAPLFARGEFKPAWFTQEEVLANARLRYHPGERGYMDVRPGAGTR